MLKEKLYSIVKTVGLEEYFSQGKINYEKSYFTILTENKFFKVLLINKKNYIDEFVNEVTVVEKFHKLLSKQPKVIKSNIKTKPYYYLRESIEGIKTGTPLNYKPEFYRMKQEKIIKIIKQLQTIPVSAFKNNKITKRTFEWYYQGWRQDRFFTAFHTDVFKKYINKPTQTKIDKLILDNKNLFNQPLVLAHGDLHGGNILNRKDELLLIDWSQLHLNNRLFDFGYLYITGWDKPSWQKEFESNIISNKSDMMLFTIIKLRWLIRQLGLAQHGLQENAKSKSLQTIVTSHINSINNIVKKI